MSRTQDQGGELIHELIPQGAGHKLRVTQKLVSHMSFCWNHPSLTLIEVAWRWLFGVPFLMVAWMQVQQILARIPPASVGLDRLNFQNPWVSSVLLADAVGQYQPAILEVLRWLAPVAVVAWAIISGIGRALLFARMKKLEAGSGEVGRSYFRKVGGLVVLQGLWMLALLGCFWLWYLGVSWAAVTHITSATEPDLVGYLCWLIFLSLGLFTLWAVLSWTLAVAPVLMMEDNITVISALGCSFRLGKSFSGKLAEVNLVLAIVKIALIVLAMVFSAAPLPFADQFGPGGLDGLYVVIVLAYLIGNDYFHVVRLRSFQGLSNYYRASKLSSLS